MTLPEQRALPYRSALDRDMGAIVIDVHGRLVAACGYHPDGAAASDESEYLVHAANEYPHAIDAAQKGLDALKYAFTYEHVQGPGIVEAIELLESVLARAKERE